MLKIFRKKRIFVIGLDGVPYTLLREFIADGIMPQMKKLCEDRLIQMDSVHPTISSVAWTTFITGVRPGKHGIYGFVDTKPKSLELYIPNYTHIKRKTLYEVLNKKKIISINVPITYPPVSLNRGIMVSGFLAPSLDKATYPGEFYKKLERINYIIDVDPWLAREGKKNEFLEKLYQAVERRFQLAKELLSEDADLYIIHLMETDRLHHFFMNHKDTIRDFYAFMDKNLGKFLSNVKDKDELILLSDHGFCPLEKEVNINSVLQKHGFLNFTKEPPDGLNNISSESSFYSMTPGRIYFYEKGEKPGASLPREKIYQRIPELKEIFKNLKDPEIQKPVIKDVLLKEEAFGANPELGAPDVLLIPNNGYDLKADLKKKEVFEKGTLVGMHTFDDAFLFINRDFSLKEKPSLSCLLPTILKLTGDGTDDSDGWSII